MAEAYCRVLELVRLCIESLEYIPLTAVGMEDCSYDLCLLVMGNRLDSPD